MSGRKRHDYVAVLRKLLEVLPQPPRVEQVVTDFERALWKAVASVMAWVGHRGCGFHWGQAVWRKIAEVGLQTAYQSDDAVYRYLRKLLALPFLPADSITTVFGQLEADATTPKLIQVPATFGPPGSMIASGCQPSGPCSGNQSARTMIARAGTTVSIIVPNAATWICIYCSRCCTTRHRWLSSWSAYLATGRCADRSAKPAGRARPSSFVCGTNMRPVIARSRGCCVRVRTCMHHAAEVTSTTVLSWTLDCTCLIYVLQNFTLMHLLIWLFIYLVYFSNRFRHYCRIRFYCRWGMS